MSRKIIGITVGTQLPKPNFKQTDPTKGDYIKNKPDFEGLKTEVHEIHDLVGDNSVSTQISDAIKNKSDVGHTHTVEEIGADLSGSAESALTSAKSYTDTKISDLINSAPTTLDTLGEIAAAMKENDDVVEALDTAIGTKANASDLTDHIDNKSNPHKVTLVQLDVTATADELNYVAGVTSRIQAQFDTLSGLVGDEKVSDRIEAAVSQKSQVQIITWGADD